MTKEEKIEVINKSNKVKLAERMRISRQGLYNKIKNKRDNGKITNKTILPSNAVLKIYCPEKKDGFVTSSPQLIYLET